MKVWIHPACTGAQTAADVMVQGRLSVPAEHNLTAYLSVIADHVCGFMATVYHFLMLLSARSHSSSQTVFFEYDSEVSALSLHL